MPRLKISAPVCYSCYCVHVPTYVNRREGGGNWLVYVKKIETFAAIFWWFIDYFIHKPCEQGRAGRWVYQMFILLRNPYLVKWSSKGEGVKKAQKTVHIVYRRPHIYVDNSYKYK